MTRVLLGHASRAIAASVLLATALCFLAFGEAIAQGSLIGGVLAGVDFLTLIYLGGSLLEGGGTGFNKLVLLVLILGKFAAVGGLLYAAIVHLGASPAGLVIGIAAALIGLTYGAARASSSAAGKQAMEQEEERIRREPQEPPP